MKILILRFSSIGDIVLTTPVIRAVKQQVPNAEVHFATKTAFEQVLASNPYIDRLHLLGKEKADLPKLIAELKQEQFDYIIDLHHNLRTLRIKAALGVKSSSFHKLNWQKWLLVRFKIDKLPRVHIVERYLGAAAPLGVKDDGQGLDYFIPESAQVPVGSLPLEFRNGYTAFAIGGQHYTKQLPTDRIIELCELLNRPVVLLGGKEDAATGMAILDWFARAAYTGQTRIYNACGQYSLNQSASLVQQAQEVFTHDTGLMHIAAALKKKIYSIWGNTVTEFGMFPFRTEFVVLERRGLSCRPCSKIGYPKCPLGHFKCMREIDFSLIGEASR